jgi:hypothetical protein
MNKYIKILIFVIVLACVALGIIVYTFPRYSGPSQETKEKMSSQSVSSTSPKKQPIDLISPNGGETWKIGQTYSIEWAPNPGSPIEIQIVNESISDSPYLLTKDFLPEDISLSGKYTFTLDKWWAPTTSGEPREVLVPVQPGQYKIRLMGLVGFPGDSSDNYFTIVQ